MIKSKTYLDGKEDVGGADDVVVLREDGPGAVNHGVGRRALLAKMHHGIWLEALKRLGQEVKVADVPNVQLNVLPTDLSPPVLQQFSPPQARILTRKGLASALKGAWDLTQS